MHDSIHSDTVVKDIENRFHLVSNYYRAVKINGIFVID